MSTNTTRKELSHDRIVDVASRAIRRAGYKGVGVADIMKEAGLTHGGFYAHFASRDALLVEAMQRAGRDSQAALSDAVARRMAKGLSWRDRLVGATPLQIDMTLVRITDHVSKHTTEDYLNTFYSTWEEVRQETFDGFLVTGAPIAHIPFEEVRY